jgi:hypothetical protein
MPIPLYLRERDVCAKKIFTNETIMHVYFWIPQSLSGKEEKMKKQTCSSKTFFQEKIQIL